jgi:DNA invertase Pin-like site-specific DNA recombinase
MTWSPLFGEIAEYAEPILRHLTAEMEACRMQQDNKHIGYASYSNKERQTSRERQLYELGWAGCLRLEEERVLGSGKRSVLPSVLNDLKPGDVLTVTKLDRLARSTQEALAIAQAIDAKGAALRILSLDLDTATTRGRQMLEVLAAAAELEQTAVMDKQDEAKRKTELKSALEHTARKLERDELALANLARIEALTAQGDSYKQIARQLGLRDSVVMAAIRELSSRKTFGSGRLEEAISTLREHVTRLRRVRLTLVGG